MKIYVVIRDVDDYLECGGGDFPDAVFLNYTNAEKYVEKKQRETDDERITWRIETWETADEKKNER